MNKFKEREKQINVQLERMGAPFRVETWSKWRNGVQNYVYHLNAPKYKTTLIVYDESILELTVSILMVRAVFLYHRYFKNMKDGLFYHHRFTN